MPIDDLPPRPEDPVDPWHGHPAWPKVQRAMRMLHLGSLLYLLFTALAWWAFLTGFGTGRMLPVPFGFIFLGWLTIGCVASLVADLIIVRALRRRRPWAWVGALVLLAIDAGSILLLPFTIIGFIAIADSEVRTAFDEPPR